MTAVSFVRYVWYAANWKGEPQSAAVYAGDPAGRRHLESVGILPAAYESGKLSGDQVLVVGPGGGRELAPDQAAIAKWLDGGGKLLAIGWDQRDADALFPRQMRIVKSEHISAFCQPQGVRSPWTGIGPADLHNRDPRDLPLVRAGAEVIGDGVLAEGPRGNVLFCQLAPWQFGPSDHYNLKRTYRRTCFVLSRALGNLGLAGSPPVLARFQSPLDPARPEQRWLSGLYLDQPEEWDDPYRFFRW